MKQRNLFCLFLFILFTSSLSYSQTVIDDFTDGNFTANQIWTGSTTGFSIITDATLPNGSATTDGSYLASNTSQGDISLAFPSTEVSEWRFSLGSPDFNPSGSNYIGVVLMASGSFTGDLINENVNNNFQGYYLRIGDSGTDPIALYRKTGSGESKVGDFPSSPSFGTGALKNGLNIRVTRSSLGIFELFYSTGFQNNSIPTTSAGTLTNTAYTTSSYFGVYQNIGSTSTNRRVYIDNIELGVVTWDGSESSTWLNAANWDTNLVPTPTDNIIIPNISGDYPTIITGESTSSLIIDSGATLVINNTSFTITNSVIYTRNLANGSQWYLMSSPVIGETFNAPWASANSVPASTQDTGNLGISWYDNTSLDTDSDGALTSDSATGHWRYLDSNDSHTFNKGQGYGIIRSGSGNITFAGTGIYTSSQTTTITYGVGNPNNFNLLGNPFTSFLNLGDFFTDNNTANLIGGTVWFWNGSSYNAKMSGILADTNFEIAPGQGFFVEAGTAATAMNNINFNINNTSHQMTDTFQRNNNSTEEIYLNISDGSNNRYAKIYYIDGTSTGFDNGYDGKLFGGITHSLAVYSHLVSDSQSKKYQIQSLPKDYENLIIPIGINAASGKEITFTAKALNLPAGIKVFLEDRNANTFTRLDEVNTNYKVILTETLNGIGRFYLHTRESSLNVKDVALNTVSIFKTDNNTIRLTGLPQGKTTFSLYSILGKQNFTASFNTNGVKDIPLPKLGSGVYFAKVQTKSGKINKKIIVE